MQDGTRRFQKACCGGVNVTLNGVQSAELKQRFEKECENGFFLDLSDTAALDHHLHELGWPDDEHVVSMERAGEGNMNLTLRVRTGARSFIVKQARPWVEKYPEITAPARRASVEAAFYQAVAAEPAVSTRMPVLLASDEQSQILILEDLGDAPDLTAIYAGDRLTIIDCRELVDYLASLHALEIEPAMREVFRNREMRRLNHAHQYDIPLRRDNGLDLDGITPGLAKTAADFKSDRTYRFAVTDLGRLYLLDGGRLVHGDYFPGSWLRTRRGVFVIDPEFCLLGFPEYDLGVLYAHLIFARHEDMWNIVRTNYTHDADWQLAARFAGAEIMRRLIGVAQLPLEADLGQKRSWLELSRVLVCG